MFCEFVILLFLVEVVLLTTEFLIFCQFLVEKRETFLVLIAWSATLATYSIFSYPLFQAIFLPCFEIKKITKNHIFSDTRGQHRLNVKTRES